ncbi:PIN domain-containing protein [Adlercreutzia sp. R21]|uniref:PIN domain-containing protein n=1 Tax=Adlercreutzia wanghongyangiae TaxID=3111451 RepID=UPI002DB7EE7A|nr:PIN domain-containing protein [Adlercreutzia sp. R21]MEC4184233.1 PIN domain-containing protein [Adlercreutzia sp. R21]
MIGIVLDTNVLVSTLMTPEGEHARALMKILEHPEAFEIIVSSQIVDEYRDVLGRSLIALRGLSEEATALLALVLEVAVEVVPKFIPALVYPDVKDKPFLEAAVYVEGLLISNNTKDFPFAGVRILKAGEFLRFAEAMGV